MNTYNWQVTDYNTDDNGKVTHIHYALEATSGSISAFSYGSLKVSGDLGVPSNLVNKDFLKAHILRSLGEDTIQRHKQKLLKKVLYS